MGCRGEGELQATINNKSALIRSKAAFVLRVASLNAQLIDRSFRELAHYVMAQAVLFGVSHCPLVSQQPSLIHLALVSSRPIKSWINATIYPTRFGISSNSECIFTSA